MAGIAAPGCGQEGEETCLYRISRFRLEAKHFLLEHDLIDTVDLACGLLADPAFTEAILYGTPYVKCFSCKRCGWGPAHSHICPALKKRNDEAWEWE